MTDSKQHENMGRMMLADYIRLLLDNRKDFVKLSVMVNNEEYVLFGKDRNHEYQLDLLNNNGCAEGTDFKFNNLIL